MASGAAARTIEIGLSCFHIPGLEIGYIHAFALAALRHGLRLL